MTTPTPASLSESLTDIGLGYTAEIPGLGKPDPELGRHIVVHAKRIATRVKPGDHRLKAFDGFTADDGYVWLPQPVHAYFESADRTWSFERWFTELAKACAAAAPLDAERLAWLTETDRQVFKPMHDAGMRISQIKQGAEGTGLVFFSPAERGRRA